MKYNKTLIAISAATVMIAAGCSKTFFNRPPVSASTVGTYYQNDAQVQASTNILYAAPWFGFNGKAFLATSELLGGNCVCYVGTDPEFGAYSNYTEGNATPAVTSTWNSLFTVVAQANALLGNLTTSVPATVDKPTLNNAIGEARLLRALAYFYLVRIFGPVPIITNPDTLTNSYATIHTNPVTDVYKFIVQELKFAESNCTPGVAHTGHVSSGSASGLLAKVYLYEQNYDSARYEAELVINSGEFGLMGIDFGTGFNDLFKISNNNNEESMIAMQWSSNAGYGFGNQIQSVVALNSTITGTGDGYGELGPSFDLQAAYKAEGDTIRRHATMMLPGEHYPEIDQASGGFTCPLNASPQGTHAAVKKYVVGTPADNGGLSAFQATSLNTYVLRYADIYLIEAEAIMGQAANPGTGHGIDTTFSTSDPTALKYFNLIRQRAGIAPVTSFTYRQLINERRLEFAVEGDGWYDLQRIDGFNNPKHPVAENIESGINKGNSSTGTSANNYTDFVLYPSYITPTDAQFLVPIPATETAADPNLLGAPVPYNFN
jgi:starch-binding outer membrane protein, SusD/RagB family